MYASTDGSVEGAEVLGLLLLWFPFLVCGCYCFAVNDVAVGGCVVGGII